MGSSSLNPFKSSGSSSNVATTTTVSPTTNYNTNISFDELAKAFLEGANLTNATNEQIAGANAVLKAKELQLTNEALKLESESLKIDSEQAEKLQKIALILGSGFLIAYIYKKKYEKR